MCVLNQDKLIWFVHTVKWIACSCHRFSYSLCSLYFICRMLCVLPCCIGAFEIFSLIYSFIYIGTCKCTSHKHSLNNLYSETFCMISNIYVNSHPVSSWHLCTWMMGRLLQGFCSILLLLCWYVSSRDDKCIKSLTFHPTPCHDCL